MDPRGEHARPCVTTIPPPPATACHTHRHMPQHTPWHTRAHLPAGAIPLWHGSWAVGRRDGGIWWDLSGITAAGSGQAPCCCWVPSVGEVLEGARGRGPGTLQAWGPRGVRTPSCECASNHGVGPPVHVGSPGPRVPEQALPVGVRVQWPGGGGRGAGTVPNLMEEPAGWHSRLTPSPSGRAAPVWHHRHGHGRAGSWEVAGVKSPLTAPSALRGTATGAAGDSHW